ncbi:hypothetical protein [Nocardia sp. NPDC059239]|uniref:hypothetical protein n=1 Tax=unclassified Nocardia TaxID=2637762 RepID=UPI00368A6C72
MTTFDQYIYGVEVTGSDSGWNYDNPDNSLSPDDQGLDGIPFDGVGGADGV